MKALFKDVGRDSEVIEIDNTLEVLQDKVGGYIEVLACPVKGTNIICNEEGKLMGLPQNVPLYDRYMNVCDVLVGDILIVGNDGNGEFADLTGEQIEECLKVYKLGVYSTER